MFTQNHFSTIIPSFQYNWQLQNIFFQLSNGIKSFRFVYHDWNSQPHISIRSLIIYSNRWFHLKWYRSSGSFLPLKSSSGYKSDSSSCWINCECTDCTMFVLLFLTKAARCSKCIFICVFFSLFRRLLVFGCLIVERIPILNSIIQMRNVFIWICFRNRFKRISESFW